MFFDFLLLLQHSTLSQSTMAETYKTTTRVYVTVEVGCETLVARGKIDFTKSTTAADDDSTEIINPITITISNHHTNEEIWQALIQTHNYSSDIHYRGQEVLSVFHKTIDLTPSYFKKPFICDFIANGDNLDLKIWNYSVAYKCVIT